MVTGFDGRRVIRLAAPDLDKHHHNHNYIFQLPPAHSIKFNPLIFKKKQGTEIVPGALFCMKLYIF
jgi:hypothetical protein